MNYELESQILFAIYGIVGYASDAHELRNGETPTNDDNPGPGDNQGLVGDTQGHSND